MAMLAGPRRKQKVVNLRAKNSAWSNDSGKFGQRMLERMGWSSGKGLGAREDGMVEHVIARYKNDECGLGYEDKNDQWTAHEDQFNALLAGLSNGGGDAETTHSGVSLEAKSKQSKARVHYHKFTRGKDLSRYSDKDLANIFGKKSLKNKRKQDDKEEKIVDEGTQMEERSALFTVGGNMDDYFTVKMKALGRTVEPVSRDYDDCAFRGFAGTQPDVEDSIDKAETFYKIEEDNCHKKKKNKKSKRECADEKRVGSEEHNAENVQLENGLKKLKKKKKCKADNALVELEESENAVLPSKSEQTDILTIKKKKSKRRKCELEEATDDDLKSKKKRKSL